MSKYDVTRADVAKTVKYIVYFQSQTYVIWNLTFGRTRKFIPPPWYGVFDMLQYFETILPLVESLWSS